METKADIKKSFQDLIVGEKPILVDFFATWCGPCKMMAPTLSQLAQDETFANKAHIIKIDIDKNPSAAAAYQISGVPTLILFKAGKILWRQSGVLSATQIKNAVLAAIN